jgi:hypothetical protein
MFCVCIEILTLSDYVLLGILLLLGYILWTRKQRPWHLCALCLCQFVCCIYEPLYKYRNTILPRHFLLGLLFFKTAYKALQFYLSWEMNVHTLATHCGSSVLCAASVTSLYILKTVMCRAPLLGILSLYLCVTKVKTWLISIGSKPERSAPRRDPAVLIAVTSTQRHGSGSGFAQIIEIKRY